MSIDSNEKVKFSKYQQDSEMQSIRDKRPSNLKSLSLSQLKGNDYKSNLKSGSDFKNKSFDEDPKYQAIRNEIDSIQAKISNIELNASKLKNNFFRKVKIFYSMPNNHERGIR